jgi:mono/diheme cytochrome c family protein
MFALTSTVASARAGDAPALPPAFAGRVDFATQVKPLLEGRCLSCHGPKKHSGEYRLDQKAFALGEGDSGHAILPGKGSESPLVKNAARIGDAPMPPDGKGTPLSPAEVGILRAWIDQGAKWPDGLTLAPATPATKGARGAGAVAVTTLPPAATRTIDFVRDVKPIFDGKCLGCHGPRKQESGLRLDAKTVVLRGGLSGAALVPGDGGKSLLVHLVAGLDPDRVMPEKGDRLTAAEVGVLRAWIDQGAKWPDGMDPPGVRSALDHWSFRAAARPQLPPLTGRHAGWAAKNPIDAFVLRGMEQQQLTPALEADRVTLARRLYLDLTGLPPSPADVDAHLADRRPDAYERLVDRLLASPAYGERWARHWLDAARYADSNGFEKDAVRSIWPYRDWVIDAMNRDLPFDRFTIEQLAGDLLPNATQAQRVATGFLRNAPLNEEGGVDPEQFRIEGLIDRIDAIGKTWLGLTINCVQCHTHKFDPIQHREYYRFFAFLNDDSEDTLEVVSPEISRRRAEIEAAAGKAIEVALTKESARDATLGARMSAWEAAGRAALATRFTVLDDTRIHAAVGLKFEKLPDHSYIARGDRYLMGDYEVTAETKLTGITGLRLELLTDSTLPYGGPGRDADGIATLSEITLEVAPLRPDQPRPQGDEVGERVPLVAASADGEPPSTSAVAKILDGDSKTHWTTERGPGRRHGDRVIVVRPQEPIGFPDGTRLVVHLIQKSGDRRTIGRFRLSVTTDPLPGASPVPVTLASTLERPWSKRTPAERHGTFLAFTRQQKGHELPAAVDALYRDWPYGPTTLVVGKRAWRRQTRVFRRGDYRKPGELITEADTPAALHPFPADAPRDRLGLARWIMSPQNPLTPRVIVNRTWAHYFGQGLVATPEDLGTRADPPSHPELLDWLASELVTSGWRMKALHRLIVTSATYKQASRLSPALLAADPFNRYLARAPRLRVEAETVHDVALAAAGLLSPKVGGPSVFPPIPDGVLSLSYGAPMKWEVSAGADRHRRALYTFWKRSVPYPALSVFDAPNGEFSCVRRVRSNTPLQALTTLNDQVFMEASQAMALRIWKEGGKDDRSRATYAFRLATARPPTARELGVVLDLLRDQRKSLASDTARALQVAATDPAAPPAGLDLHEVAPWTMVARTLLNLDETITKE